jgi:hypothetical protein
MFLVLTRIFPSATTNISSEKKSLAGFLFQNQKRKMNILILGIGFVLINECYCKTPSRTKQAFGSPGSMVGVGVGAHGAFGV